MVLLLLAFLGGVLTIVSPCILPVLQTIFFRADQAVSKERAPTRGDGSPVRGIRYVGDGRRRMGYALPAVVAWRLWLYSRSSD